MTSAHADSAVPAGDAPAGTAGGGGGGSRSAGVTVVGSINVDEIVVVPRHPEPGETLLATSSALAPGGKGANQAVAAARLGADVHMVGALGDDDRAAVALSLLADAGVDLAGVSRADAPTGIARITVDAGGENTIIVIPGANARVDAAFVAAHEQAIAAAAVVVLQGEIPATGSARAAELATGRVLLNLAPVVEMPDAVLRTADPLVVNVHEARLLLTAWGDDGGDPDDGEAAGRLRRHGIRSVVLTRGEHGAVCVDAAGVTSISSPRVAAVDTSGAGDAFVGALAARLAAGDDLRTAAAFAVRVGAFAVRGAGTQPSYPWAGDALPESGEAAQ
ncbi:ribokinase [Microbacterium sp. SYP-A9085]|uniref:ribokinase n=1 Tax=Microbacterium sp. SYP-A9085 TaxID=2664454 RepID=UPI00132351CB|nr:ribokinase [Microbacterium sp. SYP-A9085]